MRHSHGHIVLVTGGDNIVVTNGAACLCDVADTTLAGAFDIIAEGEEGIRTKGYPRLGGEPRFLFLAGKRCRFFGEQVFPVAVG